MKKLFKLLPALLLIAGLTACSDDDNNGSGSSTENKGAYIINGGGHSAQNASITKYNTSTDKTTEFYYELQNGKPISGATQMAYNYDGKVYLTGNNPDHLLVTDESFTVIDTIAIDKPRYCIGDGDYLYVSSWSANPDWGEMADTYILKYNVKTGATDKIELPGGPEGLAIAGGKLYAAFNYKKQIAAIDLSTEAISYIDLPAVSSYLICDSQNNLYATLVNSYSNPSETVGLAYINTQNNTIVETYPTDISTSYAQLLAFSNNMETLYVCAASYNENWEMVGAVKKFNTSTKTFESDLASNITGIQGVSVNPENDNVFIAVSNGVSDKGEVHIYENGTLKATKTAGADPLMTLFIK
ncbi:MAG: hypothetical protein ACK5IJ_11095 [Mangrovibacterium sp.]